MESIPEEFVFAMYPKNRRKEVVQWTGKLEQFEFERMKNRFLSFRNHQMKLMNLKHGVLFAFSFALFARALLG